MSAPERGVADHVGGAFLALGASMRYGLQEATSANVASNGMTID